MRPQHTRQFNRRRFLGALTLAVTAGLLGPHPKPVAAEPPRIKRLVRHTICLSKMEHMHDLVIGLFIHQYEFGRLI
jgi:hypothetical protein